MNIKRELFKQMLLQESFTPPVVDEFDVMHKRAATPMTDVTKNVVMNALPLVAAGLLTFGGLAGINKLMDVKDERAAKKREEKGFTEMLRLYPELRQADKNRLRMAYDAYMEYAPSTARHPMVVGQIMSEGGANVAVNASALKELAMMEKAKTDAEKGKSEIAVGVNPKFAPSYSAAAFPSPKNMYIGMDE
jgi:hypothetical protein